jgi:hypothetical protein
MAGAIHPLLASLQSSERGKIVSAAEAVRLIRVGDTVATGGFVGIGFAEGMVALEELFLPAKEAHLFGPAKLSVPRCRMLACQHLEAQRARIDQIRWRRAGRMVCGQQVTCLLLISLGEHYPLAPMGRMSLAKLRHI